MSRASRGQPLADACEAATSALPITNFHRAELLDVLSATVPDSVLHFDHRCVGLTQQGDRVEVRFQNGATADADVVVGAGRKHPHSTVREAIT